MTPRANDQDGSLAVLEATWLLVLVVLVGLATLDVGTLLRAARVAQSAADGAALVAADAGRSSSAVPPYTAADRVARAHGAHLDTCDCGAGRADTAVTLPVTTTLLHHLGVLEVHASATARLVPDPDADP